MRYFGCRVPGMTILVPLAMAIVASRSAAFGTDGLNAPLHVRRLLETFGVLDANLSCLHVERKHGTIRAVTWDCDSRERLTH